MQVAVQSVLAPCRLGPSAYRTVREFVIEAQKMLVTLANATLPYEVSCASLHHNLEMLLAVRASPWLLLRTPAQNIGDVALLCGTRESLPPLEFDPPSFRRSEQARDAWQVCGWPRHVAPMCAGQGAGARAAMGRVPGHGLCRRRPRGGGDSALSAAGKVRCSAQRHA